MEVSRKVTSLPSYISQSNVEKLEDESSVIAKSFSKAATNYNKHAVVQQPIAEFAIEQLNRVRGKGDRLILDVGCGTALKLEQIKGNTTHYLGVDLADGMLELANQQAQAQSIANAKFINANATALPLQKETVDLLYSSMALQWCKSQFDVLAEAKRVLTKHGKGVIAVLVDGSFSELEQAWAELGICSRVNQFATAKTWVEAAQRNQLICKLEQKLYFQEFHNSLAMLKSLKAIGADTQLSKASNHSRSGISKCELLALNKIMIKNQFGSKNLCKLPTALSSAHNDKQEIREGLQLTYKVAFLQIAKQ